MRAAWLALVVLAACGGRGLEPGDAAESAGGSGDARPSMGGAVPAGVGGARTSSGFTMGGALGTGGAAGSDELLMRYCSYYCQAAAQTCPVSESPNPTGCESACFSEAKIRGPECQEDMLNLLRCSVGVLSEVPDTCIQFPRAIGGSCSEQVELVRRCGLTLPGGRACMTEFDTTTGSSGMTDSCRRTSQCAGTSFEAFCQFDPVSRFVSCECNVNGDRSFQRSTFDVTNFDCLVLAVGMACGPDLGIRFQIR